MPTEISNKFTLIDIPYTMLYIHIICISVFPDTDGCTVKGKCYRSQKRNESPHDVKVNIFNLMCHTNLFFAFAASSLHITCISHSPMHLLHILILNYMLNKYIYYDWVKWRYSLWLSDSVQLQHNTCTRFQLFMHHWTKWTLWAYNGIAVPACLLQTDESESCPPTLQKLQCLRLGISLEEKKCMVVRPTKL